MLKTAARDNFIIREESYYLRLWQNFMTIGYAFPLIAEVEGEAVAALIMFVFGNTAWYFYGMSTIQQREKMPNYLLQWEAMRKAKSLGCDTYDLWGAPDNFDGKDNMTGVFRFKEGLGGVLHRTIGAWDFPNRPGLYFVYQKVLPRILDITRWIRAGKNTPGGSMSIPRVRFAHLPTPIEAMPRLSNLLQGPRLFIKRDDQTGLGMGGNKARKLEFVLGEALVADARTLITVGGIQSNHCRQTAALAAKYGFKCILVLSGVEPEIANGNLLLDNSFRGIRGLDNA